ncbi:MAG: NYN domain-containing protein [Deltaproteobacteria bacterium]
MNENSFKVAVLIDGENAQPNLLGKILSEVTKKGVVTIRRIYGDWTSPHMNGWKSALHVFAIQPIQQFKYTSGKNSTDSSLIIDAMDILHEKIVNGFCIVSSDSDYTRLATRLRESGVFIMGIGQKKTPQPFVKACELFVYTENLVDKPEASSEGGKKGVRRAAAPTEETIKLLKEAVNNVVQEDELAYLGKIGEALRKLDPSFDPRSYGFKTMTPLFRSLADHFEILTRGSSKSVYIRLRGSQGEFHDTAMPDSADKPQDDAIHDD